MSETMKNQSDVSTATSDASRPPVSRSFRVEMADGICWVRPSQPRLTLAWSEVRPSVERLVDLTHHQPLPRVVFDLGDVESFDSAYLSLMLDCWREVDLRGGLMGLCRVAPAARELLRLVALDTMWPIYADAEQAKTETLAIKASDQTPQSTPDAGPKAANHAARDSAASDPASEAAEPDEPVEPVGAAPSPSDVLPEVPGPAADGQAAV